MSNIKHKKIMKNFSLSINLQKLCLSTKILYLLDTHRNFFFFQDAHELRTPEKKCEEY